MKQKFTVIGGGVAGLCAAIRLAELGQEVLVIESGEYPAHKICGEFLSPECISYLNAWNIHPLAINEAIIRTENNELIVPFDSPAGGMSHLELDPLLVKQAVYCGVKVKTNTKVLSFKDKKLLKEPHCIELSTGETIEATNVIVAAGRFCTSLATSSCMPYIGFKAHFDNKDAKIDRLQMFSFPGAYLGVSPVEGGKANVACIANKKAIKDVDPQEFIQDLIFQSSYLQLLLPREKNLFKKWMVGSVPPFGIRRTPDWLDCYFIGDAAMGIPPASGSGLSLAICGGRLAAEYAVGGKYGEFKAAWKKRCSSQLFWAKKLHWLLQNPNYCKSVMLLSKLFPFISNKMYRFTRFAV